MTDTTEPESADAGTDADDTEEVVGTTEVAAVEGEDDGAADRGDSADETEEVAPAQVEPCPVCGDAVTDIDRFCEACGAALPLASTTVADTGAVITFRPSDALTCPYCDAPGSDATEDGYCGLCGRRWSPVREHDEWVDGPVAGVTDRGTHHWRNEDAVGVCAVSPDGFALVVCDGVSASQEPQVVAQAAVDAALPVLRDALIAPPERRRAGSPSDDTASADEDGEHLEAAILAATAAAQEAAAAVAAEPGHTFGPGACTYVAVVGRAGQAVFGSVGDSRAYWVDAGGAVQVGSDDSLAAALVAAGRVTEEEAMAAPGAHTITKWLGADSVDSTPEIRTLALTTPGQVILVSDGLWNYTPTPADFAALVADATGEETPLQLARRMVAFAEDAGGADNITVAVAPHPLPEVGGAAEDPDGDDPGDGDDGDGEVES